MQPSIKPLKGVNEIVNFKGCLRWEGAQKQAVHHKVFKGINHVDMLRRGLTIFLMTIIAIGAICIIMGFMLITVILVVTIIKPRSFSVEPTSYVVDVIDGLNKQLQKTQVNGSCFKLL